MRNDDRWVIGYFTNAHPKFNYYVNHKRLSGSGGYQFSYSETPQEAKVFTYHGAQATLAEFPPYANTFLLPLSLLNNQSHGNS